MKTLAENDEATGEGLFGLDDFDARLAEKEMSPPATLPSASPSPNPTTTTTAASSDERRSIDDFDARLAAKDPKEKPAS